VAKTLIDPALIVVSFYLWCALKKPRPISITQVVMPMAEFSQMANTILRERWTPERRQKVLDELAKGRTIPQIAEELGVPPGQLRSSLRYYDQHPKGLKPGRKKSQPMV